MWLEDTILGSGSLIKDYGISTPRQTSIFQCFLVVRLCQSSAFLQMRRGIEFVFSGRIEAACRIEFQRIKYCCKLSSCSSKHWLLLFPFGGLHYLYTRPNKKEGLVSNFENCLSSSLKLSRISVLIKFIKIPSFTECYS